MAEFLEYARRGKNAWWRYLATLALTFVLLLLVYVITGPLIGRSGLLPHDYDALAKDPSHPFWYYGEASVFAVGLLLSLLVSAVVVQNKTFQDLLGAWRWSRAATGAAAGLFLAIVSTGIDYIVHPGGFQLILGPETATLLLVAVPECLLLSLFAGLFFYGYLAQGLLLASKRPLVVAAVVGVLGVWGANNWPHAVNGLAANVALALISIRTGGVVFACGFNVANSLFGSVVAIESDDVLRGSPGIFSQTTPDLAWFDVAVSCLLLVALWLWVVRRYPATKPEPAADLFA